MRATQSCLKVLTKLSPYHCFALQAADGRVDGFQAQCMYQSPRFSRYVSTTVATEELQLLALRDYIDRTEAALHSLDEHLAHWLA